MYTYVKVLETIVIIFSDNELKVVNIYSGYMTNE